MNKNLQEKDHLELEDLLRPHIAKRLLTEPTSDVGTEIFRNGLTLLAIAKLFTREKS